MVDKINTNKANDAKTVKALKKDGWKILVVWECELKIYKIEKKLTKILERLNK
jgi:DNA mismatch endonuclease (patch repair protein)